MKWLDRAMVVSPYYFGLCLSEREFRAELKRLEVPRDSWPEFLGKHANGTLHFFEKGDGMLCAIVALGRFKGASSAQIHAMLVHEAVHLWQEVRRHLGETSPSAEFEAYSIQTISQRLMEAFDEAMAEKARK